MTGVDNIELGVADYTSWGGILSLAVMVCVCLTIMLMAKWASDRLYR